MKKLAVEFSLVRGGVTFDFFAVELLEKENLPHSTSSRKRAVIEIPNLGSGLFVVDLPFNAKGIALLLHRSEDAPVDSSYVYAMEDMISTEIQEKRWINVCFLDLDEK